MRGSFSDFPNHRITSRCIYPIWYILLVILSGYLAGCNTVAILPILQNYDQHGL